MEQIMTGRAGAALAASEGRLESWQERGCWFRYGEHAIFSRMAGRGEPLVLLHGFPTASWDWHRLWPMLCQQYTVYTLDLLGFGLSDKPLGYGYSIEDQADLVQGWLAGLGLGRVHLLTHDYGNSVAQELMAREQEGQLPFGLDSVCFLNGALFPEMHRPLLIQKVLHSRFGGLISRALGRRAFEHSFRQLFGSQNPPDDQDMDDFWMLVTYNNGRAVLPDLIRFMEERRLHRNRWVGALQAARQPLRLISGAADPVSGAAMAARYRELVPGADVVSLRHVGHYPHFEHPWEVFSAYQAFQRSVRR